MLLPIRNSAAEVKVLSTPTYGEMIRSNRAGSPFGRLGKLGCCIEGRLDLVDTDLDRDARFSRTLPQQPILCLIEQQAASCSEAQEQCESNDHDDDRKSSTATSSAHMGILPSVPGFSHRRAVR